MILPTRILSSAPIRAVLGLAMFLATTNVFAATVVWSGTSGAGTNWTTGANWVSGSAPSSTDDVKFYDAGAVAIPLQANSLVDASLWINTLQFGQTNLGHTISIATGQTLYVTNGNFIVGTTGDPLATKNLTNAVTGAGGTLVISNPASVFSIQQGTATLNGSRGNLDLSGLDTFIASGKSIGLGSTVFPNPGNGNQRLAGSLTLAKTNFITLSYTDTLANYQTAGKTNAIELSRNPGNNSGILSQIVLGQSNVINVDSMGFGRDKASASSAGVMVFNPAFTNNNPVAVFRGAAGGSSRVTWWALGDMNANASSAQVSVGTNDFTGGTVDAMINVLCLGRDCSPSHTATANIVGVFTFSAGTVNANTVYAGNQVLGPSSSLAPVRGILTLSGANAKLIVNNSLVLGNTTVASTAATNTSGTLNIFGGTVLANSITTGPASTNNIINMNNGTLMVSNAVGTQAKFLTILNTTNSTLRLQVTGNTNLFVNLLITAGITNYISLDSVAVFASYPKQVVLAKYGTLGGAGFNFGLANALAGAPGAYLSNNVANASIDLVLPTDPRPIITSNPNSFAGAPGPDVTLSATYTGVAPLTAQWRKNGVNLADGPTGNGSTLAGTATASLTITNAQEADSGSYVIVVSNTFGSATNVPAATVTISTNDIAPIINGPANVIVVQSNNATLVASVSGNPAPFIQWQKNGVDLPGENSAALTITNAQYPADQATYSIIATNNAGSVTNSGTLTVIVTPAITVQPVSVVVTNTQAASFSVTATGVPNPTYQWFFNNTPISNQTNATYNIASATSANIGTYKVVVANAAGSVASDNVTLIVNSTMSPTALSPANNATGICYDTPLTITFSVAPSLGASGTVKIYNVTNSTSPVDTINLASGAAQQRTFPGDNQSFTYTTLKVSGNTATIYPHFSVLTSNQTYYVTVDNGAFTDASGAYFAGITATNIWKFSTKIGGPVDTNSLVVNLDGSGDFLTVQGAVNSIPAGNTNACVINIRNGIYTEIVNISGKHNVTFRGQSRTGAVVGFANNATFQTVNAGTTQARMSFKVNANDIVFNTLTLSNMTPQGGSQAETLMINSNAKRCIVYNTELDSRQDTILANANSSQAYFYKCVIKGNFDYVWGGGNLYFEQCNFHTISGTGSGQFSAARTDTSATTSTNFPWLNPGGTYTANGMSIVNCTFTADTGIAPITLAGSNGTTGNNVSWYGCDFATNYFAPSASIFSGNFVFWQAQNTMTNAPVTFANLITLSGNDARLLAATNIPVWFYGWQPSIPPVITTNPVSQTVNYAAAATFTVAATGIPAPTYQWQHAGTNLPTAISATLNIASATADNSGSYACIVSTPAGNATSTTATLTVNPPPNSAPTFTAPITGTNFTINVGVNFAVACHATDSDSPAQTLAYTLLSGPSGAAVDSGTGNFTWRPSVSNAGSMNSVQVKVTDNGTPNLSATNNFSVTVNALTEPASSSIGYSGGMFSVSINGQVGPDYALQVNTNLAGGTWTTVATTNSPATMPVNLTDPNAGSQPVQFYRIVTGPPLP